MYDFLVVAPHGCASHSLIRYLNQHPRLHVADATTVFLRDIGDHERVYRPWMQSVGISAKHYFRPGIAPKILAAVARNTLIQAVRDPIESFISSYRDHQLGHKLYSLLEVPSESMTADVLIMNSVNEYIRHAAAEDTYEAGSFASHILVDVSELRGDGSAAVCGKLWKMLVGDAIVENPVFKPLGSAAFRMMRTILHFNIDIGTGPVTFGFRLEGDLAVGFFDGRLNAYVGYEERLHTYDAAQVLPNCGVTGHLYFCTIPAKWWGLPPELRKPYLARLLPHAEILLSKFNEAFGEAKKAATFTLDDLSVAQKDRLKAGIENDFETFNKRHPTVASRWLVTQNFLGN